MANYVLVHGAWHGGWCWRDTAAALRRAGHTVHAPTHTGVGQRAHLASQNITLDTHIRDVVGCIESEELDDVILVGHSYGGMVVTGVADRLGAKVKSLVYLDAFVPQHEDSLMTLLRQALPPEVAAQFVNGFRGAALDGYSGVTQPIPAAVFNVVEDQRAWVDRRCVPQSLATFEMPLLLSGGGAAVTQRTYILADGWDPSPFRHFAKLYDGKAGWDVVTFPCGHDVMVDMPAQLAEKLATLA
jgi:pimeloyl-ACP methyl ester carboxylesterase